MKLEITPEPTPSELKAIEQALEHTLERESAPALRSAWREQGVRESTQSWRGHNLKFDAGSLDPPARGSG